MTTTSPSFLAETIETASGQVQRLLERGHPGALHIRTVVDSVNREIEDGLRAACPALHMVFSDPEGDAGVTITPALNVRFGEEVERLAVLRPGDLEEPEIARAIGARGAELCRGAFAFSAMLRKERLPGVTEIVEADRETLHDILSPAMDEAAAPTA